MRTDKPLISIVMAVYDPNREWLKEQLSSLNGQTYPNLELLICDDCAVRPTDEKIFAELITKIPYKLFRNEKNLGSNKTFERLTGLANGEFIAYCDQDDVWHSDKLEMMERTLSQTGSALVYSDMNIIDGEGNKTADSIKSVYRHIKFRKGEGLFPLLIVNNCVTGCAMMMRADIAKKAMPFVDSLIHDHWLAINAAALGRIEFIPEPLIDYRRHGGNQTAMMKNVTDKRSYYSECLLPLIKRSEELRRLYSESTKTVLDQFDAFVRARVGWSQKINLKDLGTMLKYCKFSPLHVLFACAIKFMPNPVFNWVISLIKRGKI